MKMTLLCENGIADKYARVCRAEWGFSAWIESKGSSILYDAGHTDIWRENALALKIPLDSCDMVALSHHHWDHTGGLRYHEFSGKKRLIAHPDLPEKLDEKIRAVVERDFGVELSSSPVEIAPDVFFLGEIPRKTDFEKGMHKDDPMTDDTALVVRTPSGCVVISGCAHAGICNICEYAKEVTGQKLRSVIGGFHLKKEDTLQVEKTIEYFKAENPESLYPMHCVEFEVMCAFHNAFGTEKLCSGDNLIFN